MFRFFCGGLCATALPGAGRAAAMSSSFNSEGVIVVNCGAASWVAGFADEGGPTLVLPSSTEWSAMRFEPDSRGQESKLKE